MSQDVAKQINEFNHELRIVFEKTGSKSKRDSNPETSRNGLSRIEKSK